MAEYEIFTKEIVRGVYYVRARDEEEARLIFETNAPKPIIFETVSVEEIALEEVK